MTSAVADSAAGDDHGTGPGLSTATGTVAEAGTTDIPTADILTADTATTDTAARSEARRAGAAGRKALLAATVGGVVESFDWTIYAVLAPFFATQLFPGDDPATALIGAYLGFAVGFVVRPFGSYVMGRISDSRGRRFGLTLSMAVISAASVLIAVLPTAAVAGAATPVLLVLLRLVQGVSMGGENPSAAAYVTETAPRRLRFLYSSISYSGVVIGNILSFGVLTLLLATLGKHGVSGGGWRIGFLVAAGLGLLALWIRRSAEESEEFTEQAAAGSGSTAAGRRALYRASARNIAAVFLISVGATIGYYFGTTYLPQYAQQLGVSSDTASSASMLLPLLLLIAAMVGVGKLADRLGPLRTLRTGLALLALATVPLMMALAHRVLPMWVVTVVYLLLIAAPIGLTNVLFAQLFPVPVRVVAMGVPYTVATGLFGGTFPLLAQALGRAGHLTMVPWWAAGAAVVSLLGTLLIRFPDRTGPAGPTEPTG
ncbi:MULTISPECIES: MFS transporter [unclassified Streptomyces]|uniref:MFS transporter n=1 Tax=unclassified Streptomyces TaxID=2593676 RepID=UPI002E1EAAB2|nr:MFS transporter [Streptomyces sp. NBC_01023]